jgi:hypothetical protein
MTVKIAIMAVYILFCGLGWSTDRISAAQKGEASYLVQTSGSPERNGQRSEEPSPPPSQGKVQRERTQDEKPAAPPKGDPLKPFEPTEKVKADQAIDFPADI